MITIKKGINRKIGEKAMQYKIGDIVLGTVSGIQPYGAFIKLENNEQGLIHISELSSYFVKDVEQYVKLGQQIKIKVIEILEEKNLYRFSLKQVETRFRQNIRTNKPINIFTSFQVNPVIRINKHYVLALCYIHSVISRIRQAPILLVHNYNTIIDFPKFITHLRTIIRAAIVNQYYFNIFICLIQQRMHTLF